MRTALGQADATAVAHEAVDSATQWEADSGRPGIFVGDLGSLSVQGLGTLDPFGLAGEGLPGVRVGKGPMYKAWVPLMRDHGTPEAYAYARHVSVPKPAGPFHPMYVPQTAGGSSLNLPLVGDLQEFFRFEDAYVGAETGAYDKCFLSSSPDSAPLINEYT